MFPRLPRKPVSYFGSAVEAVESPMPGVKRYLKILEGEISPEYDGPQMFSSLHPLSAALLLGALTPQDERSVSHLCSQAQPSFLNLRHSQRWKLLESIVCGIVGSSSPFLAAVQIINRNQACKTRPHPLCLLQPTPWWCRGVWGGGQGAVGLLCPLPREQRDPSTHGGLFPWTGQMEKWGCNELGGGGKCTMGTRWDEGQVVGTRGDPPGRVRSRSAHGWALGQSRVRPELEA